jgi:uncharacterized secreted protein with C-terminal beta-propeller domain
MTVSTFDDKFWREEINKIEELDLLPEKEIPKTKETFSNDTQVEVQRLTTTVYVFTTVEGKMKYSHQASMKQENLGQMDWAEAKTLSKKRG